MTSPEVVVGLSGGVDSSVAALMLRDAGVPIAGLFMQNWADDGSGECRAEDDRRGRDHQPVAELDEVRLERHPPLGVLGRAWATSHAG
mgnify:CR=1 FL=1